MATIRNILWISFEDTSPRFGCYGDPVARTPQVDALAARGRLYEQAYCTAAICAPSRCAVITGMYATAIGCHHMRTSRTTPLFPDLPTPYDAVPPAHVKCVTEYLRAQGWFCTNNGKTDYQFGNPTSIWDLNEAAPEDEQEAVHWRARSDPDQPFFAVFNLGITHESGQWVGQQRAPAVTDPATVTVPPYLPDTPATRQAIAQQYDHIADNDRRVGVLLRQLEEDGLDDETAVMIWSDHGEGLPRRKSWPYASGLRVPLVVRVPGLEAGGREPGVVSLIDLAPTVLSLLGQPIPPHFQGRALLGPAARPPRTYAYGTRDRIGESYDHVRSVLDHRFTYIRNLAHLVPRGPVQTYRHQHPVYQELYRLERAGDLTPAQRWLFSPRPPEELYDREADPDEVRDLAADPAYAADLERLRSACDAWRRDSGDQGGVDEAVMVRAWYPDGVQPQTAAPVALPISADHDGTTAADGERIAAPAPLRLVVQSGTQGASLEVAHDDGPWRLCTQALTLGPGTHRIRARAIRYGFKPSEVSEWQVIVA